jgi:AcrR family transcriptional regulator
MDDIADRAGVSKPVLYQHFPGKLELYLALLDEGAERLVDTVRDALASTSDNKLRVHATIAAYYDFVANNGGVFRLVFESDLTSQAEVRELVDSANRRCADLVTKVIAEDAGLAPHESHLLAVGLTGLAQVSARSWLDRDAGVDRDTAVRLLSGLAWRGIGGFPLKA